MSIQLLDFYADWCGPCLVMNPVLEELEKEFTGKMDIKKIDVDQDQAAVEKYGVMSIPTYVIIKDEREVERLIGAQSKETMKSRISQHLS